MPLGGHPCHGLPPLPAGSRLYTAASGFVKRNLRPPGKATYKGVVRGLLRGVMRLECRRAARVEHTEGRGTTPGAVFRTARGSRAYLLRRFGRRTVGPSSAGRRGHSRGRQQLPGRRLIPVEVCSTIGIAHRPGEERDRKEPRMTANKDPLRVREEATKGVPAQVAAKRKRPGKHDPALARKGRARPRSWRARHRCSHEPTGPRSRCSVISVYEQALGSSRPRASVGPRAGDGRAADAARRLPSRFAPHSNGGNL